MCEHFDAHGVTMDGGFAEYCAYPGMSYLNIRVLRLARSSTDHCPIAKRVFPFKNLSYVDATLLEPASCAAHGLDKIAPKMGSSVLMFGAGPTGLVLAQMLRQCGGCHVVVAAPEGQKMELAEKLGAGDEYVALSRSNPQGQFDKLKAENPYGFDIVVEVCDGHLLSTFRHTVQIWMKLTHSTGHWKCKDLGRLDQLCPSWWKACRLRSLRQQGSGYMATKQNL